MPPKQTTSPKALARSGKLPAKPPNAPTSPSVAGRQLAAQLSAEELQYALELNTSSNYYVKNINAPEAPILPFALIVKSVLGGASASAIDPNKFEPLARRLAARFRLHVLARESEDEKRQPLDVKAELERLDDEVRKTTYDALLKLLELLQAQPTKRISEVSYLKIASLIGQAYALASASASASASSLEHARGLPPRFAERGPLPNGALPTALQWFETHWKPLIEEGKAGDDIRRHDLKFYEALSASLRRRGERLSDILPPSPTRARKGEGSTDPEEHVRALHRERMRRYRAKKRHPT